MSETKSGERLKVFTVEPVRLRCGLWGYPQGDIAASYSADTYMQSGKLRRTFNHARFYYVAMSMVGSGFRSKAEAYPLLPADHHAKSVHDPDTSNAAYYTGEFVCYKQTEFIFGVPAIFEQRAFSEEETVDLIRRMYAYGGYFAAHAGSYANLLKKWLADYDDPVVRKALRAELERGDLPQTRTAMRAFVQRQAKPAAGVPPEQLTLL